MHIVVLSTYPEKDEIHGKQTVGSASYTKNTLLHLTKHYPEYTFSVYAEHFIDKNTEATSHSTYTQGNTTIRRSWVRNNPLSVLGSLFTAIGEAKKRQTILLLPFEAYTFGGILTTGLLLVTIAVLRHMFSIRIITVIHQVVSDFSTLEKNRIKRALLSAGNTVLQYLLLAGSTQYVVFEEFLLTQLPDKGKRGTVIPHAVESLPHITQLKARNKLKLDANTTYVLYFGYISPYKGVADLLKQWSPTPGYQLIIAGAANPNHASNKEYMSYVENVQRLASEKNVITTGFLEENEIPLYFAAVNYLILPYKLFMSSSGPLSLAFSMGLPVLLSQPLSVYAKSKDIREALQQESIDENALTIDMRLQCIPQLEAKNGIYSRLKSFSSRMQTSRSWDVVAKQYHKLFSAVGRV
ncbi:MAG: hypothetical protein N2691_02660 [Patescibacteria group bacterium]|nr:hypothetical protein [Patescibacteria group bacterium]